MDNQTDNAGRKKMLMIGGAAAVFLLVLTVLIGSMKGNTNKSPTQKTQSISVKEDFNANPADPATMSATESKQLEEQKKVDNEYYDWQDDNNTNYPWFRKLPLHTDKYYVYFDLDKKIFIGLLYPVVGDNVEAMKADIMKQLKENKSVPVEKFTFEWTVKPK